MNWNVFKEICAWFIELKPGTFVRMIWSFFVEPNTFWSWFDHAPSQDKWRQFGVYTFLYLVCYYVFVGMIEIAEFAQSVWAELGGMSIFVLLVLLAVMIGNWRINREDIIKTFLLCYYTFILVAPWAYTALLLYVKTGSMMFLAVLFFLQIGMEFFVVFGSTILFAKNRSCIWRTILSLVVIFSLCDIVYPYLNMDEGRDVLVQDLVTRERHRLEQQLDDPYLVPAVVITNVDRTSYYLYVEPGDSVASSKGITDDIEYFTALRRDIDSLELYSSNAKYRFNRDYFSDLRTLKIHIEQIDRHKAYMNNPVLKTIYDKNPNGDTLIGTMRQFDMDTQEALVRIVNRSIDAEAIYRRICNFYYLRYLYRPVLLVKSCLALLDDSNEV